MAGRTLLVGPAFVADLHERLAHAKRDVWLQFMTFEGDAAGWAVACRLVAAARRGVTVHVLVDRYTDHFVSDTHRRHAAVRAEVESTRRMFDALREAGVHLVRTRPFGVGGVLFLYRDHRKIVVIDDSCWVGGTNISDHNHAWHDFMVRFDDPAIARDAVAVMRGTLAGQSADLDMPSGLCTNGTVAARFDSLLSGAREEVVLSSPYMAGLDLVRRMRRVPPGVRLRVFTARQNNLPLVDRLNAHVLARLARAGADVSWWTDFSHAKFLIVDRRWLLVGSSNFGQDSFLFKDEVGIVIDDATFARAAYAALVSARRDRLAPFQPVRRALPRAAAWAVAHLVDKTLGAAGPLGRPFTRVLDP